MVLQTAFYVIISCCAGGEITVTVLHGLNDMPATRLSASNALEIILQIIQEFTGTEWTAYNKGNKTVPGTFSGL